MGHEVTLFGVPAREIAKDPILRAVVAGAFERLGLPKGVLEEILYPYTEQIEIERKKRQYWVSLKADPSRAISELTQMARLAAYEPSIRDKVEGEIKANLGDDYLNFFNQVLNQHVRSIAIDAAREALAGHTFANTNQMKEHLRSYFKLHNYDIDEETLDTIVNLYRDNYVADQTIGDAVESISIEWLSENPKLKAALPEEIKPKVNELIDQYSKETDTQRKEVIASEIVRLLKNFPMTKTFASILSQEQNRARSQIASFVSKSMSDAAQISSQIVRMAQSAASQAVRQYKTLPQQLLGFYRSFIGMLRSLAVVGAPKGIVERIKEIASKYGARVAEAENAANNINTFVQYMGDIVGEVIRAITDEIEKEVQRMSKKYGVYYDDEMLRARSQILELVTNTLQDAIKVTLEFQKTGEVQQEAVLPAILGQVLGAARQPQVVVVQQPPQVQPMRPEDKRSFDDEQIDALYNSLVSYHSSRAAQRSAKQPKPPRLPASVMNIISPASNFRLSMKEFRSKVMSMGDLLGTVRTIIKSVEKTPVYKDRMLGWLEFQGKGAYFSKRITNYWQRKGRPIGELLTNPVTGYTALFNYYTDRANELEAAFNIAQQELLIRVRQIAEKNRGVAESVFYDKVFNDTEVINLSQRIAKIVDEINQLKDFVTRHIATLKLFTQQFGSYVKSAPIPTELREPQVPQMRRSYVPFSFKTKPTAKQQTATRQQQAKQQTEKRQSVQQREQQRNAPIGFRAW